MVWCMTILCFGFSLADYVSSHLHRKMIYIREDIKSFLLRISPEKGFFIAGQERTWLCHFCTELLAAILGGVFRRHQKNASAVCSVQSGDLEEGQNWWVWKRSNTLLDETEGSHSLPAKTATFIQLASYNCKSEWRFGVSPCLLSIQAQRNQQSLS